MTTGSTNETASRMPDEGEKFIDFTQWWRFLWRNLRTLAISSASVTVLGVVLVLLLPKEYTVRVSIIPSTSPSGLASQLSMLGELSGANLGGTGASMTNLYSDIITSRTVLDGVLNTEAWQDTTIRNRLFEVLEFDEDRDPQSLGVTESLMEFLCGMLVVTVNKKTEFTVVELVWDDAELAAVIVNAAVREMDEYLQNRVVTESRARRRMIEQRLVEEADSLRMAEERLLAFREANRSITFSPQSQITEMRLSRSVTIHNALYTELTQQYEIAKIDELRDMPVVNVLDWAYPTTVATGPKKKRILAVIMMLGVFGTIAVLKAREMKLIEKLMKMR